MPKSVKIHKLNKDGCETVAYYKLIGSREDTLRHAVMQLFFKRFDWWSELYKKAFDSLKIKRMPHSLLWNESDVHILVLLEEYDK